MSHHGGRRGHPLHWGPVGWGKVGRPVVKLGRHSRRQRVVVVLLLGLVAWQLGEAGLRGMHGRGTLLHFEVELQEKLFGLRVPVSPELSLVLVNLPAGHLERYGLVRLSSEQQILPLSIRGFHPLLVRRHEPVPRGCPVHDFRVIHLEQQGLLLRLRNPLLRYFVTGSSNFDEFFHFNNRFERRGLNGLLLSVPSGTFRQIRLMLFALGVRQVASLIIVKS